MSWRRPCDSERGRCCGRPSAQRVSAGRLPVSGSFPSRRPIPAQASRLRRGVDAVNLVDESAGTASTNCRTVAQVACPPLAGVATRNRVAGGVFQQGRSPTRRGHKADELQDVVQVACPPAGGGGHAELRGRGRIPAGTFAVQGESPRAEVDTRPEHANLAPSPVIRTGTRCRAADGAWNRSPFLCGLKQRDCLAETVLLQ